MKRNKAFSVGVSAREGPPGFTLIELLVVIAIISILATMLLPVLTRAKEKSRTIRCNSNLHQQALGLAIYSGDHQDSYPAYERWATLGGKQGAMTLAGGRVPVERRPLNDYVSGAEAWHCPSDKGDSLWKNMFESQYKAIFAKAVSRSCYEAMVTAI